MLHSFPYKEGDIVTLFKDWENEKQEIGPAQLVRFVQQGRSFILEDTYPEIDQVVYNTQDWIVTLTQQVNSEWDDWELPFKHTIRYIDTVGIANSADDSDYDPFEDPKLPKDKFLLFDGKEIF